MEELSNFYNDGSGWVCRRCENDLSPNGSKAAGMFIEGEAESKHADLAHRALAQWTDRTRESLTCPRCGTTERVDKR